MSYNFTKVERCYHPCTHILIDGLKRLEGGAAVLAEWDRARAQVDAAPSEEAEAFDADFLRSVARICRAAYDLCQPKPQRTPEDPREHYGELCLLGLKDIADVIERRLAAADEVDKT